MTLPTRRDTADTEGTEGTEGAGDIDDLDIAVVGLACRFPGAPDAEAYWDVIRTGTETITRLTPARMRAAGASERRLAAPGLVPAAGLIDGGTLFDAAFFGHPAREAAEMDPQQRMFLESCRHALDDAGYDAGGFPGRIGVYAGQTVGTHRPRSLDAFLGTAGDLLMAADDKDFLTTRVAYKLGLTGPAVTVQTACSTSLVAVHMACQALNTLDCDLALAGGVSWSPLRGQGTCTSRAACGRRTATCVPSTGTRRGSSPPTAWAWSRCAGSPTPARAATASTPWSRAARSTTTARTSRASPRRACRGRSA